MTSCCVLQASRDLLKDGNIGKHVEVPFTTQADVCLKACPQQQKQKSEKRKFYTFRK